MSVARRELAVANLLLQIIRDLINRAVSSALLPRLPTNLPSKPPQFSSLVTTKTHAT